MPNLYRTINKLTAQIIAGVAEHGGPEELPEDFLRDIDDSFLSLAKYALSVPGIGFDQFVQSLDNELDKDLISDEIEDPPDESELPGLIQVFKRVIKRKHDIDMMTQAMEDIETGDPQREAIGYDRISSIEPSEYREDPESIVIMPRDVDKIESLPSRAGFPKTGTIFDRWCKLGPGEVGVIIGQPGVGKSTALIDIGAGYAEYNSGIVFHFSEEMGLNPCIGRYNRRVSRGSSNYKRAWADLKARLVIEAHPTGSSTMAFLKERVERVCEALRSYPTAVIIDSTYLVRAKRNLGGLYEEHNEVIIDFRRMCDELDCGGWTGIQPQRNPAKESSGGGGMDTRLNVERILPVLTMHDVAGCWAVPQVVDYVVSLNQAQNEKEEKPPKCRVHRCKVREMEPKVAATEHTFKAAIDYPNCSLM